MHLSLEQISSPIGGILLVFEGDILRALDFQDCEHRMHLLLHRHYGAYSLKAGSAGEIGRCIKAYFDGDLAALESIAVQIGGSSFQRLVWVALRQIPVGQTRTYGQLAALLGMPNASRSVGLANGANPISLVIPCHRVLGANASLRGYAGGLPRKAWLLKHEAGAMLAAL